MLLLGLTIVAWAAPTVKVAPDERVDLISIVFHYAGNQEYSKVFIPAYAEAMEARFADLKEHPVIGMAREFRRKNGVSYNAIANLAIRLDSPESLQLTDDSLESLESRWPREQLAEFLTQLRDFARQSNFHEFYADQAPFYQKQCEFWQNAFSESQVASWAERFYGETRSLHFTVIPSALENGGVGSSMEMNGKFYCYMVTKIVPPKLPEMASSCFLAHEFSHSWTNPVTNVIYPQIRTIAEKIFPTFQDLMKRQAYGTPHTMMIETFNRAAELVYLHDRYGEDNVAKRLATERAKGFLLIERVYRCILDERKKGGASWRFSDSAQAYIDCVNAEESIQLLNDCLKEKERAVTNAPSIVSMSPANGARDVDPTLTELVITFNKPMKKGMAICQADFGSAPKFKSAAYNDNHTILTVKVQLAPNQEYRMWLNREANNNFSSTDGGILPDTEYIFYTAPAQFKGNGTIQKQKKQTKK